MYKEAPPKPLLSLIMTVEHSNLNQLLCCCATFFTLLGVFQGARVIQSIKLGQPEFDSWQGQGFFSLPLHLVWLWDPLSCLQRGYFPQKLSGWSMKLTTHLYPVLRLRVRRA